MSFYSDASLIVIPSGYKASKVYSAVPTDGTGDLTFTRSNDTATRVNSAGLIEKVRTNLVLNSATFVTQTITVGANPHTISFTGTGTIVITGTGSGTLVGTGAANRVSLSFTATAGALILTGTGTVTLAQLETGDIATDYIPTTTTAVSVGPVANVPRLDYLGSTCPRLLLEPQRTNSILQADTISSSAFTYNLCSQTSNVIGVDGYNSGRRITNGGAASDAYFERSVTTATGVWTWSIFVKQGTAATAQIRPVHVGIGGDVSFVTFTFATKTLVNSAIVISSGYQEYGNGWFRIFCSVNITGAVTSLRARYSNNNVANVYNDWAFPQLEFGSYVTSYIPTLAASVTRGADACSKTGISSLIGQSEGTIFLQFNNRLLASYPNEYIVQIISGTTQLWVRKESGDNTYTVRLIVSGVTIWTFASVSIPNGNVKLATSYKTGDSAIYLNGAQVSTTNTAAFSGSAFSDLNFNFGGTLNPELPLSQALLFKTRLSNSELASLTTL